MLDFILIFGIGVIAFGTLLFIGFRACGIGTCQHNYEKIINTVNSNGRGTVVYMCKKCGKRKVTKV